ncbi:unnamed protein product [Symbiodinium sp. CCMP2592]|nr:unnamed protein product [Symbiodinium sp. CCMP2592]
MVWPDKGLLATAFEEDNEVRSLFRQNKGHLLSWPSPELVGVASLKALALNVTVIKLAIRIWGQATPTPKAMSVDWLKNEVSGLHDMLCAGGKGKTVPIYVDSWGIKRLSTLAMRRWKAPIATLRDRTLHGLFREMTQAWGEEAAEPDQELDDDDGVAPAEDDAYPDAGDAAAEDASGSAEAPAREAEDALDAELQATEQQLQILQNYLEDRRRVRARSISVHLIHLSRTLCPGTSRLETLKVQQAASISVMMTVIMLHLRVLNSMALDPRKLQNLICLVMDPQKPQKSICLAKHQKLICMVDPRKPQNLICLVMELRKPQNLICLVMEPRKPQKLISLVMELRKPQNLICLVMEPQKPQKLICCHAEPEDPADFDVMNFKGKPSYLDQHGATKVRGDDGDGEDGVARQVVVVGEEVVAAGAVASASKAKGCQDSPSKASPSKASPSKASPSKASPSKASPSKPKPKGKAKAKSGPKAKAAPKMPPPDKATSDDGAKKRKRHAEEDKSFARRAKPKMTVPLNHWTAIRDVFRAELADTCGSVEQDSS